MDHREGEAEVFGDGSASGMGTMSEPDGSVQRQLDDEVSDGGTAEDGGDVPADKDTSAATPPEGGVTQGLSESLRGFFAETHTALVRIDEATRSFHERALAYEKVNQQLHARVEALQADQVRSLLKPAFERLATLHTQAADAASSCRERDRESAEEFEYFAASIEELLGLYDLESVAAEVGERLDVKKHHATRMKKTSDPDLDGTIQRVQRQGFAFSGAERVFLPARVGVYRHVQSEAADRSSSEEAVDHAADKSDLPQSDKEPGGIPSYD